MVKKARVLPVKGLMCLEDWEVGIHSLHMSSLVHVCKLNHRRVLNMPYLLKIDM